MDQFLLQDTRELIGSRLTWWRDGGGYTSSLDEAQVFTRQSAIAQHASRETDVPWPAEFVRARHELAVDFQYLRIKWVPQSGDELCYVAAKRDFDGNDIKWVGDSGTLPDLSKATVFTVRDAAAKYCSESDFFSYQIWPKSHVDALARPIVSVTRVSVDQALAGTGIQLIKRPVKRRANPKCYGCGRFVTADQAPGGLCRDCR